MERDSNFMVVCLDTYCYRLLSSFVANLRFSYLKDQMLLQPNLGASMKILMCQWSCPLSTFECFSQTSQNLLTCEALSSHYSQHPHDPQEWSPPNSHTQRTISDFSGLSLKQSESSGQNQGGDCGGTASAEYVVQPSFNSRRFSSFNDLLFRQSERTALALSNQSSQACAP